MYFLFTEFLNFCERFFSFFLPAYVIDCTLKNSLFAHGVRNILKNFMYPPCTSVFMHYSVVVFYEKKGIFYQFLPVLEKFFSVIGVNKLVPVNYSGDQVFLSVPRNFFYIAVYKNRSKVKSHLKSYSSKVFHEGDVTRFTFLQFFRSQFYARNIFHYA